MLAPLGLAVVVVGAAVVVFSATWLWAPGTGVLAVVASVVEGVEGEAVELGIVVGAAVVVVVVVVVGAIVVGASVEVVVVTSGAVLAVGSVGEIVGAGVSLPEAKPVTEASWASAAAGAAAATGVTMSSWAKTMAE